MRGGRTLVWAVEVYPPGDAPSKTHYVTAASKDAAVRKLAAPLDVPAWTMRGHRS